jgi:oligopeptide/dipeptide ABC transporter ATP-binding protein
MTAAGAAEAAPDREPRRVPILQVRDLHTHFQMRDGVIRAVDGVSFSVDAGACLGIVGESGSGKSITAMSIMRLVRPPGRTVSGQILLEGRDLLALNESEMRQLRGSRLSLVQQEPTSALNPVYTIGDQIGEAIRVHRDVTRADARAETIALLEAVGIPEARRRAREYPHRLSGGMQQRVAIAMALANKPDNLILDEPTTALDVTIQAQILDLVQALRRESNTTVILITHDIGVIAEMCDDVIVMYGGKVLERGNVVDVINDPKQPYTRGLLAAIPKPGMRHGRLAVIAGSVADPLRMPPGCPFAPRCPHVMDVCASMPEPTQMSNGREVSCWLYAETAGD